MQKLLQDQCHATFFSVLKMHRFALFVGLPRVEKSRVSGMVGLSYFGFRVFRENTRPQIFGFGYWVFGVFRVFGFFLKAFLLLKGFNSWLLAIFSHLFVRKHEKNGNYCSISSKLFKYCKVASVSVNFLLLIISISSMEKTRRVPAGFAFGFRVVSGF